MKLLLCFLLYLIISASSEAPAQSHDSITYPVSPDHRLRVIVSKLKPESHGMLQLIAEETSATLAALDFGKKSLAADPRFLWNADSTAVAVQLIHSQTDSRVYALLKLPTGEHVARDISAKTGNLGKLGYPRERWVRILDTPASWSDHRYSSGTKILDVRTQVWDMSGQRYTVSEPQLITATGEVPTR